MKHNLLKSVILSVILLMGVSNAWGGNNIAFQSGAFFYFDPYYSTTQTVDKGYIQLAARKYQNSGQDDYGWYTAVTTLTKIANTRLYYTSTFEGPAWTDAGLQFHGWAMISNSTAKGNGSTEYWTESNSTWYSEFKNYGLNKNSTYLFVATSASKGQSIQPNGTGYLSGGYSALNSQQTIKSAVNGADANSKATISITSYKMTGNGQVTKQTATLGTGAKDSYVTAARTATTTLTVGTVATGYQFDGWYTAATGGTKLSTSTTYTYYPTSATTVYARFSEITYSVQVKSADNNQGTVSPTSVNAGQFTGVTITATPKIGYSFANWTATAGITITSPNNASTTIKATKAGTVTANFEAQPATTIYLEPTGYWNSHNPQYVAHVWNDSEDEKDIIMTGVGESPYKYYKAEVPYGYTDVVFFRKKSDGSELWNQTADLKIPTDNKTLYEIKSTGDGRTTKATGTWKAANLVYTITLGYCDFGTYSIKYNGQSYFSKPNENVTLDVPAGAQIEILEGQPHSNAYKGDVIKSKPTEVELTIGQTLTINGDIMLDDNFVTKTSHVVYLGVPDGLTDWTSGTYGNFLWSWNTMSSFSLIASTRYFKIANTTYYEYTIPDGRHSLCFQRKTGVNDTGTPQKESIYLPFQIPLNEVNCFTLQDKKDGTRYKGTWGALPAQQGDHRLLYIEQEVGLKNGHPETTVTKAHPSDIIRQGDTRTIYSLHIYNKVENGENGMNDPEILVQECTGYDGVDPIWTTRERHMVFGPLHADFGMAAMPGRRNAAGDPVLRYDNGIENIKNDLKNIQAYNPEDPTTHFYIGKDNPTAEDYQTYIDNFKNDECSGVWNFIVTRDGSNNFTGLNLTDTKRYTGDYYVRTDCADGGWDMYTAGDNHMHFSAVSKAHSNYSHYFCKWVGEAGVNVKYTIANDYGIAISDTLEADKTDLWGKELATKMVDDDQLLPAKANVRFSWNEKTNGLHRAYIAGSTNVADRFLVLGGKTGQIYNAAGQLLTEGANNSDRYGLKDNEEIFSDIENWVYQTDVQMIPGAELQVTAKYNTQVQYFVGKEGIFNNTILQGSGTEKYLVRLLYDFKTNELISAYVPGASTHVDKISTNLMIIRQNYNEAKQLVFNNGDMSSRENRKAYGVIEFTEDYLTDGDIQYLKRCLYWVSFPFDVNLTEAFGSLVYGKHWLIQEYDGAARAQYGLWEETGTYWKLHWDPTNIVLKAGFGYVLEIDIDLMIKEKIIDTEDEKKQIAELYFPSKDPITRTIINQDTYNVKMPDHKCNVVGAGRYGDRRIYDSHWNVMGVPSYVNTGATFSDPTYALNDVVKYYYRWDGAFDQYTPMDASEQPNPFLSMYAYMVQYAGDITWNSVLLDEKPAQIAAKKNPETSEHAMRLELQQGNGILDKTFVRLQDDVVTPAFDFNYDLCKITNKGANIYSIITAETSPVEVAANVLPIEETIIPLGVKTDKAGEYTFAMPDGTDGIVVELIDYQANTTTNLLLSDYTITLPKGTNDTRFALHVKPSKVVTGVENIDNSVNGLNGETVKKYLIDGVLYLKKGNLLYDAQGRCVQ